ncbi:hypothetical protein F5888DRAFT_1635549 [Russula emetica]|nr:hypothetical protein F5888DRAFT_1635549 [Russula emetica]
MVEDLYIERAHPLQAWKNDVTENTLWFQLLLPFTAVKNLYLSKEVSPGIAAALQELVGARITEVLPSLQNILVEGLETSGPLQENIGQFIAARQLSNHPITISDWDQDSYMNSDAAVSGENLRLPSSFCGGAMSSDPRSSIGHGKEEGKPAVVLLIRQLEVLNVITTQPDNFGLGRAISSRTGEGRDGDLLGGGDGGRVGGGGCAHARTAPEVQAAAACAQIEFGNDCGDASDGYGANGILDIYSVCTLGRLVLARAIGIAKMQPRASWVSSRVHHPEYKANDPLVLAACPELTMLVLSSQASDDGNSQNGNKNPSCAQNRSHWVRLWDEDEDEDEGWHVDEEDDEEGPEPVMRKTRARGRGSASTTVRGV